jgi:hypothetical protein
MFLKKLDKIIELLEEICRKMYEKPPQHLPTSDDDVPF